MVVEELVAEIEREISLAAGYKQLDELVARRDQLVFQRDRFRRRLAQVTAAAGPTPVGAPNTVQSEIQARLQVLENELTRVKAQLHALDVELEGQFNQNWGKLFKSGEINSRFGQQVKDFACIYTSAVRNFLAYPESMYFRSPREIMPHEMHTIRAE